MTKRPPAVFLSLLTAMLFACQQEELTDQERTLLETLTIARATLPPDPSNLYADVPGAAVFGKKLYFERRFSGPLGPLNFPGANGSLGAPGETGKVGCISCHDPATGGADRRSLPNATSLGAGYTPRNSPTIVNAAYSSCWQFWDGRADSLWAQALSPPEDETEDNGSRLGVAHFIHDNYRQEYEALFGPLPDLADTVRFPPHGKPGDLAFEAMAPADKARVNRVYANFGKAIAAFERRLVSAAFAPSAFDRFMAGDLGALPPAAIRGAKLFVGRAGCYECHRGPLLTDFAFHNIGIPQEGRYVYPTDPGRFAAIEAVKADPFNRGGAYSDQITRDHLGEDLVATEAHLGQFKTPTLRNVARTAPYMHNGIYQTLWEVVDHYNFGGGPGRYAGTKDPALVPLLLDQAEMAELVEFLRSLDDGPPLPTPDFPEGLTSPPAPLASP